MTDKYVHFKGSVNEDGTGQADVPVKFTDTGSGLALPVAVVGAVSISQGAITSTISYIATTGGTGYSIGDHITATLFWDASNLANPAFLIAAWYNWDTALEIATPNMAHLTTVSEDNLTDTQLRAAPVPVSAASLPLPTGAATQDTLAALLTELQLKADLTESQPTKQTPLSSATIYVVSSSASSGILLNSNANRRSFCLHNDSTAALYLKFGTTAATNNYTVKIPADAYYEMPMPVYTGRIDGVWASANGDAKITEGT